MAPDARAADFPVGDERKVEVHGFVSPGFMLTTGNNWFAKSKRGSFEFTEVGINFTVPLTDKLRTGIQLFSRDLGALGNYTPRVDWFYLDYKLEDWLGVRAGRVKIPFGLYNDVADIDAARVPILLPQSVYSLTSRDFLLAQTGGEVYGRVRLGSLGAFEYRLFGGTIFVDPGNQTTSAQPITNVDVPYVVGERAMWETPLEGLRVGGTLEAAKLNLDFIIPPGNPQYPPGPSTLGLRAVIGILSAEYVRDRLLLATEYARSTAQYDSPLLPPQAPIVTESFYAMASYRFASWFTPGLYYSATYATVADRSGRDKSMHDVAATLRFDVNPWWIVKLEGHAISGTAGLDPALNGGTPTTAMTQNWGAFFVKSTVHF
ncbi:MAG: hypothetical protein KF837_06220 [Labilithrix sp.]|nr:hypothetical protein [Labilithrix sp.]